MTRCCSREFSMVGSIGLVSIMGWCIAIDRCGADEPKVYAVDAFSEKFALQWEPIRHDESMVSLSKNPGKLTITTQKGTLGGNQNLPGRVASKNLFLIPNPVADGGDFVVTTCIDSLHPKFQWQQAGILIYNDDDNYLKHDMEFDGRSPRFKFIREREQYRRVSTDSVAPEANRIWIRITKRGNVYERGYSTDGKTFVSEGEQGWGDGSPNWIGLTAVNGGTNAPGIDAQFDFFEIRELTDGERNDPRHLERMKLEGKWNIVGCEMGGKTLAESPLSEFEFHGAIVSYTENGQATAVEYSLDIDTAPKGFEMYSMAASTTSAAATGIYQLTDDALTICLTLVKNGEAPTAFETDSGDGRLLLTLKRAEQ